MSAESCVVVGGGFAGLAAAVRLADAGVRVQLFEARPTLGGRANTFRDPVTGERVDNGQHVLAGCYVATLKFLERLGTGASLHWPSSLRVAMIDEDGRHTELAFPALPPPINLLAGILSWDALTVSDRWAVLRIGNALRGREPMRRDETVREWLQRYHQSARLCRLFWEPLALAALNQSIDQAAADMFVAVTSRMFSGHPDAAAILVPALPLDELYARPAERLLVDAGGRVETRAKAQVIIEDDAVVGVRVGGEYIAASTVVCAVPWFALADAIAAPPASLARTLRDAGSLGSAPIVTVDLWFDRWRSPEPMLGLPGRHFQWMFDRRRYMPEAQQHLSMISSGADTICAQSNEWLIATALRELRDALPAARAEEPRHATVIRERRATFSLMPGSPPRPATTTPVRGLVLAGDWIDTGLPATIESAVIAGERAAAAALSCLQ